MTADDNAVAKTGGDGDSARNVADCDDVGGSCASQAGAERAGTRGSRECWIAVCR